MIEAAAPVPPVVLSMVLFPVEPDSTVKVALPEFEENVRLRGPLLILAFWTIMNLVSASLLASNVSDLTV